MLKLLLVSATKAEIEPLFLKMRQTSADTYLLGKAEIKVCITGVGMVNTALQLGMLTGEQFDLAVNAGICGTFGNEVPGTVVNVTSDFFAELGAEDGDKFIGVDELGFGSAEIRPLRMFQHPMISDLPAFRGITVNKVHGNSRSIETLLKRYPAQTETMEGAAFFAAANALGWTCLQLRAVSNRVEKRNRDNWQIPLAVKNLNELIQKLLNVL